MPAHSFNHWAHNRLWVVLFFFPPSFFFSFSFTTANDEVTVYFPTGRCLGDASLSAERWRNPQFLPTWVESWGQSVKSCRTWRHVFRALCVFHRCALFLTCTKATRVNTSLESVTLMPWAACLVYDIISQCVLFKPACSWRLLKYPVPSMSDGEARASNLLGGVSMSHICSMSKTCFYLNAHWQHVGLQDHSLPTHMHIFFTVQYSRMTLPQTVSSSRFLSFRVSTCEPLI